MRLVDADALVKELQQQIEFDKYKPNTKGALVNFIILSCINEINNIPTAYSIEKVVKELKKRIVIEPLDCADAEWNNALYKAIEIVKEGVENEHKN